MDDLVILLQVFFTFAALFSIAAAFRRQGWDTVLSLSAAAAIMGSVSFLAMIVSWWFLPAVKMQTGLAAYSSLAVVFLMFKAVAHRQWEDEVFVPVAIGFALTLALLIWAYAGAGTHNPLDIAATRWTHELPPDNRLPFYVAEAFRSGVVGVGKDAPNMGDWLYSDRPPLQTAMFLLTPGSMIQGPTPWNYESAAVSFQMLALVGVWCLVRSFSATPWMAALAVATAFFTPLVLVNGIFVWPKLSAASFLLFLASFYLSPKYREVSSSWPVAALGGALAALAMLSHGGSAFGLAGIVLTFALLGRLARWRAAIIFVIAAGALYAPWVCYQKFVDPPGDRLLKWHLAGAVDIDSRPLGQTFLDSYRAKTLREIVDAKRANVEVLYADYLEDVTQSIVAASAVVRGDLQDARSIVRPVRVSQFFHLMASTGLYGVFFILIPIGLIWGRDTRPLALALLIVLSAWVALMFSPGSTDVHQGSYLPQLALIALASVALSRLWQAAFVGFAVLHIGLTIFQYSL